MTPVQIAKSHCANYQPNGSCLGVYYNDDLSISRIAGLRRCLLGGPIRRCPYFEECVMPMKLENRSREMQDRKRAEFEEGLHQYRMAVAGIRGKRLCRDCQQRDTGSRSRQLCNECRSKHRKETYRKSQRRSRDAKCQHSSVVSSSLSNTENAALTASAMTIPPIAAHR